MPATAEGKAVAARNATTHGLFARDVVLPALGEDARGYQAVQDSLTGQLCPNNLIEHHYVEKIAAASWRLRRLHRWQAQLFEDDTLSESERLDRLDKALRHETALHRQIDTAVKMLAREVPDLYARRECAEDEAGIDLEVRGRLRRIRKATDAEARSLSAAPLDAAPDSSESDRRTSDSGSLSLLPDAPPPNDKKCENEPAALTPDSPLLGAGGPPTPRPDRRTLPAFAGTCPPKARGAGPAPDDPANARPRICRQQDSSFSRR